MLSYFNELTNDELHAIANDFQRLSDKHYLDHAGATLYSEQQVNSVCENLKENLLGNPHTSKATEDLIDQVRYKILNLFNADPTEYSLIFTSGATAALKIVGECFDFRKSGRYFYIEENHTSVLGMREIVKTNHIHVITREQLLANLESKTVKCSNNEEKNDDESNNLITFSAQCNFSGYKYPLKLVSLIQKNGLIDCGKCLRGNHIDNDFSKENRTWYTCLDAASFAATNFLDLSKYKSDYVCVSFYKIFGYPTGLGALLVSKRGQKVLHKNYFGGGTVKIAMSSEDFYDKRDCFHEKFEDGTISFLSIPALLSGFDTIQRLIPQRNGLNSMQRISQRVFELGKYCCDLLKSMTYNNGNSLVKIYSHTDFKNADSQGGIVTFNLLHEDGSFIGFAEVACIASIYNIHLRTGCFCNPGACQVFLGLENNDLKIHYKAGHICGDYNDLINNVPTGAVRVSFGYMSKKEDIDALIFMLKDCYTKDISKRLEIFEKMDIPKRLKHVPERLKKTRSKISLREICIYPIKSCGAYKTKTNWELTDKGLLYDRSWMIINSNGVALTQKTEIKLCLIQPTIDLNRNCLLINYPGKKPNKVPLIITNNNYISSTFCHSKVCGDLVECIDCGDSIAEWLTDCLSIPGLRLIQQRNDIERKTKTGKTKDIALSNQAQFLLINYTSVKWLVSKIEDWSDINDSDIDGIVDRFRGNLIIETTDPLEETEFKSLQIGDENYFTVDGFCTRCQMICIDQATGCKTAEPLRTIAKEFQGKIRFGIYLSQRHRTSNLEKSIISCKDHIFIEK